MSAKTPLQVHFELMQRLGVRTVHGIRRVGNHQEQRQLDTIALNLRIKALIDEGKNNTEIAVELEVSPQTVGRHRRGALKALK